MKARNISIQAGLSSHVGSAVAISYDQRSQISMTLNLKKCSGNKAMHDNGYTAHNLSVSSIQDVPDSQRTNRPSDLQSKTRREWSAAEKANECTQVASA